METPETYDPSARAVRDANEPPPEPVAQEPDGILIPKKACVALLCVPLAYLTWVALNVLFRVPKLQMLLMDMELEAPMPLSTRFLLRTYAFWWLLPVGLAAVTIDIARRKRPSGAYVGGVFVGECLACWLLQAIATEGGMAPIFQLFELLGE